MDPRSKIGEFLSLAGKTALVTGGAMGIGKAIALRLSEVGAHVVVADLNAEAGQKTVGLIHKNGGSAELSLIDVTDGAGVTAAIDKTAKEHGGLHVLVNNAGIYPMRPFLEVDDALWQKTLDINVMGVARCARAAIPHMKTQGGGAIVNLASIASFRPHGDLVHYEASKAAVLMLTRSLAWEVRGTGIRVNAVAPGGIQTPGTFTNRPPADVPGTAEKLQAVGQAFFARLPLGKMGHSDDVARAVLFLASPMSDYVTGACLAVDGGYLAS